jgi:hypothetical protein
VDKALWQEAGTDYFYKRIDSRYLTPIGQLQSHETQGGEGFSIVTIQCALIEFLAAMVEGKNYSFEKTKDPHAYSNSGDLFRTFLSSQDPFAKSFTKDIATDFYKSVRCGLLHEARTKNGWRIKTTAPGGRTVDAAKKILYRHRLHKDLEQFIASYRKRLLSDKALQAAFIRKFDALCDLPPK